MLHEFYNTLSNVSKMLLPTIPPISSPLILHTILFTEYIDFKNDKSRDFLNEYLSSCNVLKNGFVDDGLMVA